MTTTTKELFIEMVQKQAQEKMQSSDRRRRLDGRLELATLEIVKDVLPNKVKYNRRFVPISLALYVPQTRRKKQ